jgi:hypothetical protein
MFRICWLAALFVLSLPTVSIASPSECAQVTDLAGARVRWAAIRQKSKDPANTENNCRAYSKSFFEAVQARQTVAYCGEGSDRQHDLSLLDLEINAFNNLIASQCQLG